MGILDSIVEWIATQVMNLLDLITGSVLGALGCDMSTFLRYFPAAETLYEIFVAIGVGFILLNLVWQLFRNFGLGLGLSAEELYQASIRGSGEIHSRRRSDLHSSSRIRYRGIRKHIKCL